MFELLENALKGTSKEGELERLFNGQRESVIKCTNVEYESVRSETFSSIQIHQQESGTLEDAIKELFKAEDLTGEN